MKAFLKKYSFIFIIYGFIFLAFIRLGAFWSPDRTYLLGDSTLGAIHLSTIVENISTILDPKESALLWDPNFAGVGIPALSEIIIGYFYPPNWLVVFGALLLHDPLSTIPLHTLLIFLHLGFSSIFIFKLLREHWGTKYYSALIGAISWMGIGFNIEYIASAPVLFAGSYLPFLVFTLLQWGKTSKKLYFAIFYIALAFSFLSGYPMVSIIAYVTSLLIYIFNCDEAFRYDFIKQTIFHQLIGLLLITLPLVAPFYFTVVEYFPYSVRSLMPLSGFLNNSTPISFLAEIFLPKDIPDNAQKGIDIFNVFGFTGLLIIFQSNIEIFRQKRNYIILILLIFCLIISIGKVSNIAQIIYFLLPGINLFRRLSVFSIIVGFAFSIFVAQAFESATQNSSLSKITLFIAKLLLFFFLFAQSISIATLPLLTEYINPEILMKSITTTFIFGGLTIVSLFLYKRTPQIAVAILISALLIEIGTGITTKVTLNSKVNPVLFFKPNVLIQRLQELVQPMDRVDMRIVQNTYNTSYLGLEQTNGYLALGSKYTSDLTQAIYSDSNRRNNVRELLGISYEVVNVDAGSAGGDYLSIIEVPKYDVNHEEFYKNINGKWVPEIEGKKFGIRKNSNILPRLFWAKSIQSKNQTADILNEFDSAESRDVFINPSQFRDDVEPVGGTVVIEEYKRNYIKAKVLSQSAGYLANSTAYYPGWTIKIDGVSSKPIQTNWFMMGTYVPSGEHLVEFSFFPTGLKIGIVYFFASLLLWLFLLIVKVERVKKYLRRLLNR